MKAVLAAQKEPLHNRNGSFWGCLELRQADVYSAKLCAVLGIGLGVKRYLLALTQRSEALYLDGREVNEHILAALFIGNEAVAFFRIEPFYRTFIHWVQPP